MRIFLDFAPAQTLSHRARLTYAFRLFSAIYGHQPILQTAEAGSADICISYAEAPDRHKSPRTVKLVSSYRVRNPREAAPAPRSFTSGSEATVLVHWPSEGPNPDWLGEIFEWVSCADEYSVTSRDSIGRVPFRDTYSGRHKLDIWLPYAAIAMRLLQAEISKQVPAAPAEPLPPVPGAAHFIVNTHDVDVLPLGRMGSVRRMAKNSAISLLLHKSPRLALGQVRKLLGLVSGGKDPFDQITQLAEREREEEITASYYFIPQRKHRKDANYSLDQPQAADFVRVVERIGMEVGLHGSFTSLDRADGLASEFEFLGEQGFWPVGERQHWLRFTLDRLIPAVEKAQALYDTSLGWSDRVGFRAGACFAFPPYNFEREAAATFLEIPLAIMDQCLLQAPQKRKSPFEEAAELLAISRRYGWGGISLLWHPAAFDAVQLPQEIGDAFWQLVGQRSSWNDRWLSGLDFMNQVRMRYESAGFAFNHNQRRLLGGGTMKVGRIEQDGRKADL